MSSETLGKWKTTVRDYEARRTQRPWKSREWKEPLSNFCASIVRKRWEYVLQVSRTESSVQGKEREGKAVKSINSRFSVTRVPPIVAAPLLSSAREKDETAPFHYPSPCLFTSPSTPPWNREKKWNHSLVVSFGKGEKNKWLTTRENIIEKSPPLDYLFLGL